MEPQASGMHEQLDDNQLVERAQAGDREAFGELVRRHRAKLYGYAQSVTREPFLAEDIVQEALIRAFLHLGTLTDLSRFLPWLHRIVRNQAYTRLKKTGQRSREQTFSVLKPALGEAEETDWSDLDSILARLSRSMHQAVHQADHPEEALMRKELFETIEGMLRCLNERERKVVESHFFDQLSPQEISSLFHLSSANVYQILSRSRKKLIRIKTLTSIDHYLNERKEMGCMKQKVLPKPKALTLDPNTWTSCAWAMYAMLEFTDRNYSLPMVMGLSGHAFRINVMEGDIHIAGPTMYDFAGLLGRGLRNLGYTVRTMWHRQPAYELVNSNLVAPSLMTPEAREKRELPQALPDALELIHQSIDQGVPVLSWDLFLPEFGIIYGYDDEKRMVMAADNCENDQWIPFDHLGRGLIQELFVLAIDPRTGEEAQPNLKSALEMILDHYHGKEAREPRCVNGLDAYDAWCAAFRAGTIEPNGNSYNLAVVYDARRYAAAFLEELADTPDGLLQGLDEARTLSRKAAASARATADRLEQLCAMFPFPSGGEPNNPAQADKAIQLLLSAKESERETVAILEKVAHLL